MQTEEVGRPRKRGPEETLALGFKASPEVVRALDTIAAQMTAAQPLGQAKVTRTDVIKLAIDRLIEAEKPRLQRK